MFKLELTEKAQRTEDLEFALQENLRNKGIFSINN